MELDRTPAPIDEALLKPLGKIVATSNVLEYFLAYVLAQATSVDDSTRTGYRVKTLGGLITDFDKEFRERCSPPLLPGTSAWESLPSEWTGLHRALEEICEQRNRFVHAYWLGAGQEGVSTGLRVKKLKEGKGAFKSMAFNADAKQMETLVDEMEKLGARLLKFSDVLTDYLLRWREITGKV